ncbi:MAG: 30S ribosomal protein S9 [Bacteroidetes bacterium]|nr:MAG: 30S ribosomal protein S9 [Bacteroidota bacterium]
MEMINAIGRRKGAVARVYLTQGEGKVTINGRTLEEYFPQPHIRTKVNAPFQTVEIDNKIYDLRINVNGGGFKGQAEAIRMAIARVLVKLNEDFRKPLKDQRFLTRDARVVERKKYGKPKARKSFQFSKR